MKVSWKWLNELIDIKHISLGEITDKLILAGFEVEEIINKPEIQDKTIDISITANRRDISSIIELGREIGILFNLKNFQSYKNINIKNKNKQSTKQDYCLNNLKSNTLLYFQINTVSKVRYHIKPTWLINYLKACDIKPTNTVYDITNYIRIKWGQNIDILDLDKIEKNSKSNAFLNIELLKEKEEWMNFSDSCNFNINKSIEVLKYNNLTLSIIGIKSNPEFKCDTHTSSIIVIGEICKEQYLKQVVKSINIKTEKLNRHLEYISINDAISAYNEAIQLISGLTNSNINQIYSFNKHHDHTVERKINVNKKDIVKILGPLQKNDKVLSDATIFEILKQLDFQPTYINQSFRVTIPKYRQSDLKRSIDIVEEIGRVYGFNKFLDRLPKYSEKGKISKTAKYIKKIRYILSYLGLYEIINYSLEKSEIKSTTSKVTLYNPLLGDQSQLKNNLIKDLILTKKYNIKKKNSLLEFFEIGRVFYKKNTSTYNNKYEETLNIAGIIGNANFSQMSWEEKSQSMSWSQAKGLLEDFLEKFNTDIIWVKPEKKQNLMINNDWNSICHPHRISILYSKKNNEQIGIFSELNTKYNNDINSNHRTYIFELNLFKLIKAINKKKHISHIYKPYSSYPTITRDISLKLNRNKTAISIQEHILNLSNPFIKSVDIFNEYNHIDNLKQYRNIGFRITYQSNMKTLNEKDINDINKEITKLLQNIERYS
uniref:phenylalanine--tRNA ligase n=1 Tax=Mastocarpus papillatus TaxID=31436 RepID=A0A342RZC5_9FLOR|nr:phenylalanyl-tRNA synthetase beta chain [Mastocarpus papillatus]AOL58071.1 phenylalanyl-tRNA synthetase beta chain [Mastocarpus papillatus]